METTNTANANSNTTAPYSPCAPHTTSLSSSVIDVTGAETHVISAHHTADQCWLLLDSCSTVNLISDKDLLTDIHPVPHRLQVRCNAGSVVINHQGYLSSYPEPVWFNPEGIANLMSIHNVQWYYQVTFNTTEDNAFYINNDGGHRTRWEPSGHGLYHYTQQHQCIMWSPACKSSYQHHDRECQWFYLSSMSKCPMSPSPTEHCDAPWG